MSVKEDCKRLKELAMEDKRRTIQSERKSIQVGMFKSIYAANAELGNIERFAKAIVFSSDYLFAGAIEGRESELLEYIKYLDETEAYAINEKRLQETLGASC